MSVRLDELDAARGYYDRAEMLYNAVRDTVGKLNVLIGNARLARRQGNLEVAKQYYQQLFEITDGHPAFRNHPITQNLRQEYAQLTGWAANSPATLPADAVQALAGNTVAVLTGVPERRVEWRGELGRLRAGFAGRGPDWASAVAFADALLAILDGESPALPPDNPYAGVVQQVLAAIAGDRPGSA